MSNTSDFDFDAVMERQLPPGFAGVRRRVVPVEELVFEAGPLTDDDIEAAGNWLESEDNIGYVRSPLEQMRHRHHRVAQLMVGGMVDAQISALTGYARGTLDMLKTDPSFIELQAYYAERREEEFDEFNTAAAELSTSMLHRLGELLDTQPEKLGASVLLEAIRTLRDYSGNGPVAKSANFNMNVGIGDRMEAARARRAKLIES